ncbi:hypothetical protein AG1IA_01047 [Rhizoctonia solani AG-1 IA]|uniref:Uncharacterized protein n=1 Tax=Thanatephorus cucumeris (strain AG1-IA) TaxID=983506 RepID=L8X8F2_THACA|nr:hypothetical protein AG1IA_01047 [Rhizoctonia solani AG-1 IA]
MQLTFLATLLAADKHVQPLRCNSVLCDQSIPLEYYIRKSLHEGLYLSFYSICTCQPGCIIWAGDPVNGPKERVNAMPRWYQYTHHVSASPLHTNVPLVALLVCHDTLSLLTVLSARASTLA